MNSLFDLFACLVISLDILWLRVCSNRCRFLSLRELLCAYLSDSRCLFPVQMIWQLMGNIVAIEYIGSLRKNVVKSLLYRLQRLHNKNIGNDGYNNKASTPPFRTIKYNYAYQLYFQYPPQLFYYNSFLVYLLMAQRYKERLLASSGYSNKKVESEFGEKILKMMGWTEGRGLGKTEDGIAECVQQRRREEGQGLGVADKKSFKWNDNWWDNIYTTAMKKFKHVKKSKDQEESTSSSSESDDSCNSSCSSSESDNSTINYQKRKGTKPKESKEESVKTKKIHKKIVIIKRQKKEKKAQEEE